MLDRCAWTAACIPELVYLICKVETFTQMQDKNMRDILVAGSAAAVATIALALYELHSGSSGSIDVFNVVKSNLAWSLTSCTPDLPTSNIQFTIMHVPRSPGISVEARCTHNSICICTLDCLGAYITRTRIMLKTAL